MVFFLTVWWMCATDQGGATLLKRCATEENCRSSREDSSSLVSSSSSEPRWQYRSERAIGDTTRERLWKKIHEAPLWAISVTVQTYCQNNWCPPQSPAGGWIPLSASEDRSSPDPGKTCAFSPRWFQLQTTREIMTNGSDWAVVSSSDYDGSTDATCEVIQSLTKHISMW